MHKSFEILLINISIVRLNSTDVQTYNSTDGTSKTLLAHLIKITKNQCLSELPSTLSRVLVGLHFLEFNLN